MAWAVLPMATRVKHHADVVSVIQTTYIISHVCSSCNKEGAFTKQRYCAIIIADLL